MAHFSSKPCATDCCDCQVVFENCLIRWRCIEPYYIQIFRNLSPTESLLVYFTGGLFGGPQNTVGSFMPSPGDYTVYLFRAGLDREEVRFSFTAEQLNDCCTESPFCHAYLTAQNAGDVVITLSDFTGCLDQLNGTYIFSYWQNHRRFFIPSSPPCVSADVLWSEWFLDLFATYVGAGVPEDYCKYHVKLSLNGLALGGGLLGLGQTASSQPFRLPCSFEQESIDVQLQGRRRIAPFDLFIAGEGNVTLEILR